MSEHSFNKTLVESLDDKELNQIALFYLSEIEELRGISIVDGTNDSGVDLSNRDLDKIDRQYQATTTKERSFKGKIKSDLKKAKDNVDEKGFTNKVLYFYSRKLTIEKKDEYRKLALNDFNIKLNFVSADEFASEASINAELKQKLLKLNNITKSDFEQNKYNTPNIRAYYDLMTIGVSTDIKYNILKSFVINLLFKQGETSKSGVLTNLNNNFKSKISEQYFDVFIKKLQSKNCIKIQENFISLKPDEKNRINELHTTLSQHETHLRNSLSSILSKYEITDHIDELIKRIIVLSESRFSETYQELIEKKSDFKIFVNALKDFKNYISSLIKDDNKIDNLLKEITEFIDNDELISIIASGNTYTNLNSLDDLENYIEQNHNNKSIFLDTNVLIYLILNYYDGEIIHENEKHKIISQFFKYSIDKNLELTTIYQYVIESANLFKYAFKLIPLSKGSHGSLITGTNNVVYNFFIYLQENDLLQKNENFEEFLNRFGVNRRTYSANKGIENQIENILLNLKIYIEDLKQYDLKGTEELMTRHFYGTKSEKAIKNDSLMFERLGDNDTDINPLEPIFCTWDFSLMDFREKYFNFKPQSTKWFMYTPSRLIEHFSMMNLSVGKGSLTNEVLLILEEDIDFNNKTKSLIDSILTLIDTDNSIGMKYYEKINEIKEKEINQIEDFSGKLEESENKYNTSSDLILSNFFEMLSDQKSKLEDFFKNENYLSEFAEIIVANVEYHLQKERINPDFEKQVKVMFKKFEEEEKK